MRRLATVPVLLWATIAWSSEASYVLRGPQLPVEVAANGYVQSVTPTGDGGMVVRVATELSPVGSDGSYAEVAASPAAGVPPGFELPRKLRTRLRKDLSAWDAATSILEWVDRHVRLHAADAGPQDAVTVLARGHGRCSGVANAATALLLAAGFEARTVSGLLVSGNRVIPHRWLECRLPGAGWVPTDPTLGLWALTPRHLAFADFVAQLPELEILDVTDGDIDHLPRLRGRPVRPNRGAELVCRLLGDEKSADVIAVMSRQGGELFRARLDPEVRFAGLLPGSWRLDVLVDGRRVESHRLELGAGRTHSFAVKLPP